MFPSRSRTTARFPTSTETIVAFLRNGASQFEALTRENVWLDAGLWYVYVGAQVFCCPLDDPLYADIHVHR